MNNKWAEMAMARVAKQHDVTLEEVRSEINDLLYSGCFEGILAEDITPEDAITYFALLFDLVSSEEERQDVAAQG